MRRIYIIYDGRAIDNTNEAALMVTCDSLKEARSYKGAFGNGCIVWSYAKQGKKLTDERFEEVL